jgi:hypothetical protein
MKTKTKPFWYELRLRIEAAIAPMIPLIFIVALVAFGMFTLYQGHKMDQTLTALEQEKEELISELTAYRVMEEWKRFEEERR